MKKIFFFFFMAAISLFATAQSTVQVSNVTDLKAALKNPAVTTVQLTQDMPDDELIGEYCYNADKKNIVGKKILDLNGHKVWANSYTMLYTALTDTLVITGNGTWNCDGAYGFDCGDNEQESVTAGVLIIENGTFTYEDGYAFFAPGWNNWASRVQFIVNGGTFNLTDKYSSFIYCKADYNHSSGTKPKLILNDCIVNCNFGFFRTNETVDVQIYGGSYYSTGELSASQFQNENISIPSGKVAYIGGEKYTRSKLDYDSSNSGDMVYATIFQISDSESDFIEVKLEASSEGKVGLNTHYYGTLLTSGKFLKNSPFKLKAIATPDYGKDFNGWGELKNISLKDPKQKEVEFAIAEKNISMKAFFGSNMPTDFYVDNVHYYITYGSQVKVGSGEKDSGDGITDGYKGSIEIPAKVTYNSKEYTVFSISDYAFYGQTGLTSFELADGSLVESIGSYAFAGCTSLTGAYLDEAELSYLGEGAFYNCSKLSILWIGDNTIYEIPNYCFYGCSALQDITAWSGWSSLNTIGAHAFENCTELIDDWRAPWHESGLLMIGHYAFANCKSFTSFEVGESVNQIGEHAFDGCNLAFVKVPSPSTLVDFVDTTFPNNTKVYVPCDSYSTLSPTWYFMPWDLRGYNGDINISTSSMGATDNENMSGSGYGTITQVADCSNPAKITLSATPSYDSRFYRWVYWEDEETITNYENPMVLTHSYEINSITAEFASPEQVIVRMEYATEDGSALPSDFGNVTFYLGKQGETAKEYKGPSVWRKCEKYDEMEIDPSYINLTATVGNVQDYRYEFAKWANDNATTPSTTLSVESDIVFKALLRELPKYTCTVSADPAEGGSATLVFGDDVTEIQEYEGQPVRFYATPKTGWEFSHWDNDLTNTNTTLEVLNLSKDEAHVAHFKREVTLSFGPKISGTGTVTASPASSGNKYWSGTKVKLTATPATNYEFTRWVDDGTTNPEREITVGYENATYTAIFSPKMGTVNVTVVPAGSATVSGAGQFIFGTIVNLSYEAAEGYEFKSWQREGYSLVEEDGDFDFVLDAHSVNITLTMQEKKPAQPLTIKLSCTQGAPMTEDLLARFIDFSVYPMEYEFVKWDEDNNLVMQGYYPYGTEVSIEYFASEAYSFVRWENNETEFDREITMDDAKTLTMYIKPRKWDFEVIAYDNKGTVTADKTYFYFNDIFTSDPDYEWSLTLTATPKSGYTFLGWGDPNLPIAFGEVYDWFDGRYANIEEYFADMQAYYALVQAKEERTDDEEVAYQYIKMLLTPSQTLSKEQVRMLADDNMELDYEDHIARVVAYFTVATGVENVSEGSIGAEKTLRDGILLIQRNGKLYNAQGKLVR